MKKKSKKKQVPVPSYAFGIDAIGKGAAGLGSVVGAGMQGASSEGSGANIAGSALGGAAKGVSAGAALGPIGMVAGGVIGLAGGLFGGFKKRNAIREKKRRENSAKNAEIGLNNAAEVESDYWDENNLAYSYADGGVIPTDLAFLDNNEVIRDTDGNIVQVPNTRPGTDNHLVDASNLESVLSDKIKRPGTKKTFAQEGERLAKMNKPSKGTDKFAQNTDRLNKINANKRYNQLLIEQEEVKDRKGIKPKTKGIPAYATGYEGDERSGTAQWLMDNWYSGQTGTARSDAKKKAATINRTDSIPTADFPRVPPVQSFPGAPNVPMTQPAQTGSNDKSYSDINDQWTKLAGGLPVAAHALTASALRDFFLTPAKGNAVNKQLTRAYSAPLNKGGFGNYTYWDTDEQPSSTPTASTASPILAPQIDVNEEDVTLAEPGVPSVRKRSSYTRSGSVPAQVQPTPTAPRILQADIYPDVYSGELAQTPNAVESPTQFTPQEALRRSKAERASAMASERSGLGSFDMGNLGDLTSLAPTLYNFVNSFRSPESESTVTNPYAGAATRAMARRRINIEPTLSANRRSRAIANYNMANLNANTGMNIAGRTQMAASEYANNADIYANRDNANNAYLGEYANLMNNLGQQYVQSRTLANDLNARNRASARNYGATAATQIGEWAQIQQQMKNQRNRDDMVYPLLENFLSQGYTSDQIKQIRKANYGSK